MDTKSAEALDGPLQPHRGLRSPSFLGLLFTQLLTAINDNAFRWLVIGFGKQTLQASGSEEYTGAILAAGTACFVLPYLLFAAPAGYLADRYSKRTVIIARKGRELVSSINIPSSHETWLTTSKAPPSAGRFSRP